MSALLCPRIMFSHWIAVTFSVLVTAAYEKGRTIQETKGTSGGCRYHDMLDEMDKYKIVPNATLHHFVHPAWFEDIGGFTKEANVPIFVEWARTAYRLFGKRIQLWATFNEPTCHTFCRQGALLG